MIVLACPAINGFYSVVAYSWEKDGSIIPGESTALLYCSSEGIYSCHIKGVNINYRQDFQVSSKYRKVTML